MCARRIERRICWRLSPVCTSLICLKAINRNQEQSLAETENGELHMSNRLLFAHSLSANQSERLSCVMTLDLILMDFAFTDSQRPFI